MVKTLIPKAPVKNRRKTLEIQRSLQRARAFVPPYCRPAKAGIHSIGALTLEKNAPAVLNVRARTGIARQGRRVRDQQERIPLATRHLWKPGETSV
jgi:hypothetical protein